MAERRPRKRPEIDLTTPDHTDDLGLNPAYDEDNMDLGYTVAEIQTASRILAGILGQGNQSSLAPILIGEIKPALELQLGQAVRRQETDKKLAKLQEVENKGRRRFLAKVGEVVGFSALMTAPVGGLMYLTYVAELSPEAQARKAAEKQARKEALERDQILGLTPTAVSESGWRVKYPASERNVDYVKAGNNIFTVVSGTNIKFPSHIFESGDTNISLSDYTRLDGKVVPQLSIVVQNQREGKSRIIEDWILRDQPTEGIDTRVVVLENPKKGELQYFSIERTKSANAAFQVEVLQLQRITP